MNTVDGYIQEIRVLHGQIVQNFIEGYTNSDGAKTDQTLIAYMNAKETGLRTALAGSTMDTLHKANIEGLQGNNADLTALSVAENRTAYARAVNEMNKLLTGTERFNII